MSSSVIKWPDLQTVDRAARDWVDRQVRNRKEVLRAGYFGSYARGEWGVSSDLDLILIVKQSNQPFWRRSLDWDATSLPVPVDLLVYTQEEWQHLVKEGGRFSREIEEEAVWILESPLWKQDRI